MADIVAQTNGGETWLGGVWEFLRAPWISADWSDAVGFWYGSVFDDRLVVVLCLLFIPLLIATRGRALQYAIIGTGVAFIAYLCGVLYLALWLLICVGLYFFGERYAIECRRTDVLPIGPPLAAWAIIGGGYLASFFLWRIPFPDGLEDWVTTHTPWLLPMGLRGLVWEPNLLKLVPAKLTTEAGSAPLLTAFAMAHNVGTAYLVVRMLTYFADIRREQIPEGRRSLLRFLTYVCYAPSLLQGPIERYPAFQDEIDSCHERRGWHNVLPGTARIGLGFAKGLIATLYFFPVTRDVLTNRFFSGAYYETPEQIESYAFLWFGVYIHVFWLYLEFGAYCDISAGIARLMGYRQIENFNNPFISRSLREFWRRWHISLSYIIRDYIYIPLGGNRRHVTLNFCLAFGLVGVWHFPLIQAAVWGVVMGFLLAVNRWWVLWVKRLDEQPERCMSGVRRGFVRVPILPSFLAWLVTMLAFGWSLLFLFGGGAGWRVPAELFRRTVTLFTDGAGS